MHCLAKVVSITDATYSCVCQLIIFLSAFGFSIIFMVYLILVEPYKRRALYYEFTSNIENIMRQNSSTFVVVLNFKSTVIIHVD